jgi:hypothetical protein
MEVTSVLDRFKSGFGEKVNNLELKDERIAGVAESRKFNRLKLTHQVYFEISKGMAKHESAIDALWGKKTDICDKIDLIKVLSSPLLSYYKNMKRFVFSKLLIEIDNLLSKPSGKIEFFDFNLLIVLMKQLTEMKSNFIIRVAFRACPVFPSAPVLFFMVIYRGIVCFWGRQGVVKLGDY